MKKCPFCFTELPDEAIYCQHCGKHLDTAPKNKWYHRTWSLIVSFCVVGPFMLPLIWTNPKLSRTAKIIWSVVAIGLTFWLIKASVDVFRKLNETLQQMS